MARRSRRLKTGSPRSAKMRATGIDAEASMSASTSTNRHPSRLARRLPTAVFPVPMNPVSVMFMGSPAPVPR